MKTSEISNEKSKKKKSNKVYSLKTSLLLVTTICVAFAMIVLSSIAYMNSKKIIEEHSRNEMSQCLSFAIESINKSLSNNLKISETLAHSVEAIHKQSILSNPFGSDWEENSYKDILTSFIDSNDETFGGGIWFEPYKYRSDIMFFSPYCMRENGAVTYIDNYNLGENVYYTDQDWYKSVSTSKDGESKWSSPYYDEFVKKSMITSSTPIYDTDGEIMGVATADIDLSYIQEMILSLNMVANGKVILIDQNGTYIATEDSSKILNNNILSDEDTNIAKLGQTVLANKEGKCSLTLNNEKYNALYEEIPETGWFIISMASENQLLSSAYHLKNVLSVFSVIFFIILIIVLFIYLQRFIIRPIYSLSNTAEQIANGNLNITISKLSNNEFGEVSQYMQTMVERLHQYSGYISETSSILNDISNGNFKFNLSYDYLGEFADLKNGLIKTRNMLSGTLLTISSVSKEVDNGAASLAKASQMQAQEATEQTASIKELSDMMEDIEQSADMNAQSTQNVNKTITEVLQEAKNGDKQINIMLSAMDDMTSTSKEIEKIVKNIEDIAFQTNILALNAAVEAARAGSAGKGFAVVADEVRNLASKTSEASKETAELIEKTLASVDNGKKLADETAKSFKIVSDGISKAFEQTEIITKYSENQKNSIRQATSGVIQLSDVVNMNTAHAQEGAAASEELSAQSQMLKNLVDKFELYQE